MKLKPLPSLLLCLLLFLSGLCAGRQWALKEKEATIRISVVAQEQPFEFHVPLPEFFGGKK